LKKAEILRIKPKANNKREQNQTASKIIQVFEISSSSEQRTEARAAIKQTQVDKCMACVYQEEAVRGGAPSLMGKMCSLCTLTAHNDNTHTQ
jgi:hypothetical protein